MQARKMHTVRINFIGAKAIVLAWSSLGIGALLMKSELKKSSYLDFKGVEVRKKSPSQSFIGVPLRRNNRASSLNKFYCSVHHVR